MPLTVNRNGTHWLICLEGEANITSAAQLKDVLLEGLAGAQELELDLERASEIDVTVLQLLWAAAREAARAGSGFVSRVSHAAASVARDLGFEGFPGAAGQMGHTGEAGQTQG